MTNTHMEYAEFKLPDDILAKIQNSVEEAQNDPAKTPITLGEAGVMDWLTNMSRTNGWRAVWNGFNFPYIVMEREVTADTSSSQG